MNRGLVAVTGGTGFLGRRLTVALLTAGWRVRVLARGPTAGLWGDADPQVTIGDVRDPAALGALTQGAEALVHVAGLIKAANRAAFFDVNAEGARLAAEAALTAGCGRVVQLSSLAAREPALSDYAASKRAGECAARAILGDRLMVMRPPAIYGPGDRETLGLFQLAGSSPFIPMPRSTTTRLALAHVDDVARQVTDSLDTAWAGGTFAFGGARPAGYGWREIFMAAAAAMGGSPILVPTPDWAIHGSAALVEAIGRIRGNPTIFNRGKASELLHEDWSVNAREQHPMAFTPSFDLDAGFEQTVTWYRREGWLA